METIYTGNMGQKLFLYHTNNALYFRSIFGTDISRPILLCSDYSHGLSSVIYQNAIHFSYCSQTGDLLIRNIMETEPLFVLSAAKSPDCEAPKLFSFCSHLLLLYYMKNPLDNSYLLKLLYPLEDRELSANTIVFSSLPSLHFIQWSDQLLLCFEEASAFTSYLLSKDTLQPTEIIDRNAVKENITQELSSKYQTKLLACEQTIAQQTTLIQSIKEQYEALMNTASRYKEEAAKWHNKYYSRK